MKTGAVRKYGITMNRVQPLGVFGAAGLLMACSGAAIGQQSQFPGADKPNQWQTTGNPSATPLRSPGSPVSPVLPGSPVAPPASTGPQPRPVVTPNIAPPGQFPGSTQPNQWDVRGNPGANPLISPYSPPAAQPPAVRPPSRWHPTHPIPPGWGYYPWGGYTVLWNGQNRIVYWNGYQVPAFIPRPFGGVVYLYDPNLIPGANRTSAEAQQPPPQPEPTPFERGLLAFRAGRSADAAKIWKDVVHSDHEDVATMRLLSLALFESREVDNAAAMMRQAYRSDPTLASRELDSDLLNLTASRRSVLVNRASEYANRVGSSSGWLSVVVLMQTDRRYDLARRMLKRAADEGLEPDVRSALDAALAAKVRLPRSTTVTRPAITPAITPAVTPAVTPAPASPPPASPPPATSAPATGPDAAPVSTIPPAK